MNKILEGLNLEQAEAVTHKSGPLLIIAGAGTGKTTVVTRRIAWLLSEGRALPEEILALTFTDKAARAMQEKVDILVPYGYTDIWISTFHAFGDRLLRENALIAGLNPDFKVMTQPEAAVFLREHLFEFDLQRYRPLSEPTRFIEAMLSLFSRARDEDVSAREYLDFAERLVLKSKENPEDAALAEVAACASEVAGAYAKYQDLLERAGLVDFSNQFYLALKLLREHPLVLKECRRRFKYILVDEFQDTNYTQYQLARLLSGDSGNITVCGDDDQCIYRFRGAAYSNLLNFIKDFPHARQINIIRNYRSTQPILDSAYGLIQHNNPERFEVKAKIDKRLVGPTKDGPAPQHLHFDTISTEADNVAAMIKTKVASGDFKYRDFAILVRANSDAQPFLQALNMQEIPWQFSGNQGLYAREEVKLCINFLRTAANFSDSMNLYYLISSEVYELGLAELGLCAHFARRRNKPLYEVLHGLESIVELSGVNDEFRQKVKRVLRDLEKFLKFSRQESTGRLLYRFLTETGYLKTLTAEQNLENEIKIQNLAKFFNLVRNFELVAKEDRVINFVNYLNLMIEAGDDPSCAEADLDTDAVNALTIHKAKGLEFRVVFLVSLVQGRFPWPRRSQPIELPEELIKEALPSGDFHIQEERRLFYVGMTRAKEELYLASADDYGGARLRKISQFVMEALGQEKKQVEKKKATALEAIKRFAPKEETRPPGKSAPDAQKQVQLSYYHIDDYLTCPLKYKYVNILRVPILEHHTVIYGRAMHEAVTRYFQLKIQNKSMTLAELLGVFKENFDPQGFLDVKHQEERLRTGCAALERFFSEEAGRKWLPKFIEKPFSFIFENNRISGRFDRVDERDGKTVIVDFKTSNIQKQKEADKRAQESLQLGLYALAYKNIFDVDVEQVELYFLESGLIGTGGVNEDMLDDVKEKVRKVSEGIRKQEFTATPKYMACTYCAYNQICPSAALK